MSEGYNTPKIGRSGPTSPAASEKTTSSRAVLAALRALQDKIARLEGERAEAVHATSELRARLREAEARLDSAGIEPTPVRGGGDELDEQLGQLLGREVAVGVGIDTTEEGERALIATPQPPLRLGDRARSHQLGKEWHD